MKKVMTAAVGILTLGATLAFAAPPEGRGGFGEHGGGRGHHGRRGGAGMDRMAEKLSLSDAQKEQITAIRKANREQNRTFFDAARSTREEMRAARKANDTAKLESLKATMQSQREQMKQIHQGVERQIASVLTADQRAKLEAMKAERAQRHQEGKSRRGDKAPRR